MRSLKAVCSTMPETLPPGPCQIYKQTREFCLESFDKICQESSWKQPQAQTALLYSGSQGVLLLASCSAAAVDLLVSSCEGTALGQGKHWTLGAWPPRNTVESASS